MKSSGHGRALLLALIALGGAACGNYSNEDVDFQLAVPARDDLSVKLPTQQALTSADAAEYLTVTHQTVGVFNQFVDGLTGIVDAVRAYAPSERQGDVRLWGPFLNDADHAWELRLRMTRGSDGAAGQRFLYEIEFHRVGDAAAPWQRLIAGTFAPATGFRRGTGEVELTLVAARAAGYPVAEWKDLQTLHIKYQRTTAPITVELTFENLPSNETPGGTYSYAEAADGAGAMNFVWRRRDNALVQALGIMARWRPDGAGRADARVVDGVPALLNAVVGIDCWGPEGRNTYLRRDVAPKREVGLPASCVFGPPP